MCFLFMNFTPLKADVKCAQNDHITVDFKNMELKRGGERRGGCLKARRLFKGAGMRRRERSEDDSTAA